MYKFIKISASLLVASIAFVANASDGETQSNNARSGRYYLGVHGTSIFKSPAFARRDKSEMYGNESNELGITFGYDYSMADNLFIPQDKLLVGFETGYYFDRNMFHYVKLNSRFDKEVHLVYASNSMPLLAKVAYAFSSGFEIIGKAGASFNHYKPRVKIGTTGIEHKSYTAFAPKVAFAVKAKIVEGTYFNVEASYTFGKSMQDKFNRDKQSAQEGEAAIQSRTLSFGFIQDLPF